LKISLFIPVLSGDAKKHSDEQNNWANS